MEAEKGASPQPSSLSSAGSMASLSGVDEESLRREVGRLRGMLKTGTDALQAETEKVASLQARLNGLQGGSVSSEEGELRRRLAEAASELEREKAANRTLAAKLTALGAPVPSH